MRGHEHSEGNLNSLLKLRAEDFPMLEKWLSKEKMKMTHYSIQNEILQLMAHEILRKISKKINSQTPVFSIICDATRDISGAEQESVCVRFVDEELNPIESFLGFYTASDVTAEGISNILKDAMIRLQLPIENLRGQTYDGASTMRGKKGGVQKLMKDDQPLALFVHCGAHCINLVVKDMCDASTTVRNAMQWAHELGVLFNQSTKAKAKFIKIKELGNDGPVGNIGKLRPLCPTRWIYRYSQINEILKNYHDILDTLQELSLENNLNSASGLLKLFQSGTVVLGLLMVKDIVGQMETFNKCLQSKQISVSSMINGIEDLKKYVNDERSEENFLQIFEKAQKFSHENDLEEIILPRKRKVPRKYFGEGAEYTPKTALDFYKKEYYALLDAAIVSLNSRFCQEDLKTVNSLEETLFLKNASENEKIIKCYPEIESDELEAELKLFHRKYAASSVAEVLQHLKSMTTDVRHMFGNIEKVMRLLLVLPSSSCEAERSFSSLRRLKTYLRGTMSQSRLNHIAVCNIHKEELDSLALEEIAFKFIACNERRKQIFGSFKN